MFTGIITDVGTLMQCEGDAGRRLTIATAYDMAAVETGASIACNGICLTVTEKGPGWFAADVSPTTLAVTTLGAWQAGQRINLERALRLGDELGGHMVSGHVDGVATIIACAPDTPVASPPHEAAGAAHFTLACPPALAHCIAAKGSVTLDGISLTVTQVDGAHFGVTLIPHTLAVTAWGERQAGDRVNLEVDMLARYMERMLAYRQGSRI